jgi:hypothetical protein
VDGNESAPEETYSVNMARPNTVIKRKRIRGPNDTLTVELLSTDVRFTQARQTFELWSDVRERRRIFDFIKAAT